MNHELIEKITQMIRSGGRVVVLTGAGISAESGIPTFRGPEGYWTTGSKNYRPEEMATYRMFSQMPEEVWQWYLYRLGVCRNAEPNAGHRAVVDMEEALGERFLLITQNVDGLHLRAGSSPECTYQIHGNIEFVRCGHECTAEIFPIPGLQAGAPHAAPLPATLTAKDREALTCPKCGRWLRPHVLWFDEYYDEEHFRFNSSIEAASKADILISVGTSGATNLPLQVGMTVARRKGLIIDVNPVRNSFTEIAERSGGYFLQGPAGEILPEIGAVVRQRPGE